MKSRIFFLLTMTLLFSLQMKAQFQVGATLGIQLPMAEMGDAYGPGIGFNLAGKYQISDETAIGLNLGANHFTTDDKDISGTLTPITLLFEYYLKNGEVKPYFGLDLGFYNYSVKMDFGSSTLTDSEFYFGFAPSAGFLYGLKDNLWLAGALKFNYVLTDGESADWLGLNVGVMLDL